MVDETAGCLDLFPGVTKCPLTRNHFNINKFATRTEDDFRFVAVAVKETLASEAFTHQEDVPPEVTQLPQSRPQSQSNKVDKAKKERTRSPQRIKSPSATVDKNCRECQKLSLPEENEWQPCPVHCRACPRTEPRTALDRLTFSTVVELAEYDELCENHAELKKRRARTKRLQSEAIKQEQRNRPVGYNTTIPPMRFSSSRGYSTTPVSKYTATPHRDNVTSPFANYTPATYSSTLRPTYSRLG